MIQFTENPQEWVADGLLQQALLTLAEELEGRIGASEFCHSDALGTTPFGFAGWHGRPSDPDNWARRRTRTI